MTAVQSLLDQIKGASYEALEMEREQNMNLIIEFQIFMNDHGFISNFLWDFEDMAIKFLESKAQINDCGRDTI